MARVIPVSAEDAKASEGGAFKAYPAGNYIGVITDVKDTKAAKQGDNAKLDALNVQVKFTESNTGAGVGKKFTAFRVPLFTKWASGAVAFLFYQFAKALGQDTSKDGEVEIPDNEELLGQEIGIRLKIEPDNKGVDRNVVAAFFDPAQGVGDPVADVEETGSGNDGLIDL